ncbi:MAG TPA: hypothetical protein DCE49_08865 [Pseudomonas sp.]|nr:hypothetical protein [Pseudomonas sp.]
MHLYMVINASISLQFLRLDALNSMQTIMGNTKRSGSRTLSDLHHLACQIPSASIRSAVKQFQDYLHGHLFPPTRWISRVASFRTARLTCLLGN